MADEKKFEEALMKILEHGRFEKARLSAVSSAIVGLKKSGFVIDQVHIKGQPPVWDRIIINGIPDPEFFIKFRPGGNMNIQELRLFPYGIINPEGWRAQLEIGV